MFSGKTFTRLWRRQSALVHQDKQAYLNEAGFGIAEVMIASALMAVGALSFSQLQTNQQRALNGNRTLSERDLLINRVARIAGDAVSINTSALDSRNQGPASQFHDCVLGGASTACDNTVCSPTSPCDLTLLDPTGNKVAGPPSQPQYYDLSGASCTPTSSTDNKCAIQAITQFWSNCGSAATTCAMAKSLTVSYTIQQRPNVILASGPPLKAATNTIITGLPLVVSTSGTVGALAKFTSSNTLGDSIVTESGGNIGIGVTSPTAKLEVNGPIKPGSGTVGAACAPEGALAYDMTAHSPVFCNNSAVWAKMGGGGGALLVNNADASLGTPVTVPANTCTNAIRVDMQMDTHRIDSLPSAVYRQSFFTILVDGASGIDTVIMAGSKKEQVGSGGDGFIWLYEAYGISKSFFITDVASSHTLTPVLNLDPVSCVYNPHFSVSCM